MDDPRIGTSLGAYKINSVLGRGGMGVVYAAEHTHLRRHVALKVLADTLASDHSFRERFERESQLAASLDHANIVQIYDAGEIDGVLFLSMRLVPGQNLKEVVGSEGPLEIERSLSILDGIASALDAAHSAGLVHRDVKPQNVLISRDSGGKERAFLTDFGLTKRSRSETNLTAAGMFLGTVDYASPEQIESSAIDGRSDQYSLACVAYEVLTGSIPYSKPTELATIYAHMEERPPPVEKLNESLPVSINAVIHKAMARNQEERYESCGAFVSELRHSLEVRDRTETFVGPGGWDTAVTPPPVSAPTQPGPYTTPTPGGPDDHPTTPVTWEPAAKKRSFAPLIIAIVLLVALIGAGTVFLLTRDDDPAPAPPNATPVTPATPATPATPSITSPPQGNPVRLQPVSVLASNTAPPGIEASGQAVSYDADNAIDGDPTSTWRVAGDGIGESLLLDFGKPVTVTSIGLIPGYAKIDPTDGTDRFFQSRRVIEVEYVFSDNTSVSQTFKQIAKVQSINVNVVTNSITIRILQTTPDGGRDFTPISEVEVNGFP